MKARTTALTLSLLTLCLIGVAELPKSELDVKKITRTVAYTLPLYHLNQLPLDAGISTNAYNLFIDSLDPARSYFLQSDIDSFQKESTNLHKALRRGDISFAQNVLTTLMERLDNRVQFTKALLEEGFDTEINENFQWDRDDANWPASEQEWDELWRKRVKNEYITRLVSKQVYATDETNTTASITTSTNAISATDSNTNAAEEAEFDFGAEFANMTPEEFILNRYEQFKNLMDSFDDEILLQRYLSSFSLVYDPHSDYMSPSTVEDFDINMKLSLVGIGAMLRSEDGSAQITRVMPGGPAELDGRLKAGDKIIAVAQEGKKPVSILNWPLYKAVRLIRGEIDSTVTLTVIPASDRTGSRTKKIDIVRKEVKLEDSAAKSELKEITLPNGETRRLGVINLPDFYADFGAHNKKDARRASTDVRNLIHELMKENIEGLILDLRNNGGGSLVEAIDISGLFITSGPIVQVKDHRQVQVLPDADPVVEYDGPMIVLVNRLSASASEILAAALQDYKRALIVGGKTHGKGTVQQLMPLRNGKGSLKLTTQSYYRINGGSTQLKGVMPDIILPSYYDVMDIGEDTLEHAFPWTTIRKAMYRERKGFAAQLPTLIENSERRLAKNEEFQIFLNKRERLKKRYETKTISLKLEERIHEAEAEKELDDIQSGALLNEDESDDEEKKDDIILEETLSILSDMIDLNETPAL